MLVMEKSALSGLSGVRKGKNGGQENLWTKILSDVQSGDRNKLPSCKSIVVLGDNESGKTTLVAKLQGNEDPKKGSGLEYAYIDVRDDYRDDHTRLSVWILDGDPKHADLLEYALNEKNFEHSLVILTVSMTTPWGVMDQLHTWASVLQDHIDKLQIEPDDFKDQQNKIIRLWQDYVEPGDELEANSPMKRSSRNFEDDPVLPLPDNVLTRNLGIPLMVVVTKTDYMATLEKEMDYKEEHFDFIQHSVRKFCLQYGAALFYTSVKEDKNCDLLYKYLVHRIYSLPFRTPALVVEKDAVFIPTGWDNEKKIAILYENMHSMTPEDYYTDVITKPQLVRKAVTREIEIQAEDENTFLARLQAQLQAGANMPPGGIPGRQDSPLRQSPAVQKTAERRISATSSPSQLGSPKKVDPTKPGSGVSSESLLATFFNALLTKKTVPTSPTSASVSLNVDNSVMRSDAAAELDRITRMKKPSLGIPNDTLPSSNSLGSQGSLEVNNSINNSSSEC